MLTVVLVGLLVASTVVAAILLREAVRMVAEAWRDVRA